MTPAQCRVARKLLGWGRERLAAKSETSADIIRTFELTGRVQRSYILSRPADKIAAIRAALEAAGIEFIDGEAPGVRLRWPSAG